jgi:hypothetical protein
MPCISREGGTVMSKVTECKDVKTIDELKDMPYQIKYRIQDGDWQYGLISNYHSQAKEEFAKGNLIIEDAITGNLATLEYKHDAIEIEEIPFGSYNMETGWSDEYGQFVEAEHKKAREISDSAGEGLKVGKMFTTGVADGFASYVVTKVNKKTVDIEWRGFCCDRYYDQILGAGGRFDRSIIEAQVRMGDGMSKLFG